MNTESQIDAALRRMGREQPPLGLERRLLIRLEEPQRRFISVHSLSAFAIAASLAVAVVALSPLAANLGFLHAPAAGSALPRVMVPAKGTFGAASAVNVPSAPLPLTPAPVNHGRGHTRSGRLLPPVGSRTPRANDLAVPSEPSGREVLLGSHISVAPATITVVPPPKAARR